MRFITVSIRWRQRSYLRATLIVIAGNALWRAIHLAVIVRDLNVYEPTLRGMSAGIGGVRRRRSVSKLTAGGHDDVVSLVLSKDGGGGRCRRSSENDERPSLKTNGAANAAREFRPWEGRTGSSATGYEQQIGGEPSISPMVGPPLRFELVSDACGGFRRFLQEYSAKGFLAAG